jgi:hypothetical protein
MDNERAELEATVAALPPEEQEKLLNIPKSSTPNVSVEAEASLEQAVEPQPAKQVEVPEKFLSEDGTPDTEKILKSYQELEKQYSKKAQQKQPIEATASVETPQVTEDDPWLQIDKFVESKLSQREQKLREIEIAKSNPDLVDALYRKNEERITQGLPPISLLDAADAQVLTQKEVQKALNAERKMLEQSVQEQQKAQVEGIKAAASREPASINDLVNKASSQAELNELRGFLETLVK